MTKEEFAQTIKQKYPAYQDMDDLELADRMLDKYPVYRSKIEEKSTLRKIGDFFTGSAQKFGKTLGTAASVINPRTSKMREETISSTQKTIDTLLQNARQEPDKEKAKKKLEAIQKLAQTDDIDIFNQPEYQKTAKQVFGEGLGTALEIASVGTFGGASKAPTLVKPLLKKTLAEGVKTGAKIGGAFGAGFGVSEALQEDKSFGDVAKEGVISGAIGATGGAVLGGAVSGITEGTSALVGKVSKLKPVFKSKLGDAVYNKLNEVSRDILKMSPTASKNEAKWNKNTPKFLVDEGIVQLIESDGKKLSTGNAITAIKEKYQAENAAFNSVLRDSGQYVSLDKLKNTALNNISDLKSRGSDYNKAQKYIIDEIASLKNNYKDTGLVQGDDLLINIEDFNKIKSGLWSRTSSFSATQADKLTSDINYRIGQVARDLIEETVEDAGIKSMNSRLGDFISAIKVLENAEGKTVPGGFFGKQFARLAGTIAGSGSIPGAVVGNITGGALAELMINPKIKTGALTKFLEKLRKSEGGYNIIEEAEQILNKRGEERARRLLLESPKSIPLGAKSDTSRLLSQEEAEQILRELIPEEEILLLPEKATPSKIELPRETETTKIKKISEKHRQRVSKELKENILNDLNPTGGLFTDYNPERIVKMKLGKNITTLDKTAGESPDKLIKIYRGAISGQKDIVPGDFITTNEQLAKDYAGGGKIISKEVKMSDLLDDITEPLAEEYIYRPKK